MALLNLYLATEKTLIRLNREVSFERVPMKGEFISIGVGGVWPQRIDEVTHLPDGRAEIFLTVSRHVDGGWDLYGTDEELREEVSALVSAGWSVSSEVENRRFRNYIGAGRSNTEGEE